MQGYTVRWINPQREPSYNALTLIIEGPYGHERIDKVFPKSLELTPEVLEAEADREILRIEAENTPIPQEIV